LTLQHTFVAANEGIDLRKLTVKRNRCDSKTFFEGISRFDFVSAVELQRELRKARANAVPGCDK
jgi:hypothetical protein